MENNYNNTNETNNQNQNIIDVSVNRTTDMVTYDAPQKNAKKHRKFNGFAAIASMLAVAIIAGSAGFGGVMLADSLHLGDKPSSNISQNSQTPTLSASDTEALSNLENTVTGSGKKYTAEELFEKVESSIVIVNNYTKGSISSNNNTYSFEDIFGGNFGNDNSKNNNANEYKLTSTGSGVVFTTDGYIITNYHVIENAGKVSVVIDDYNDDEKTIELEAKVIGGDKSTDIAVLKVSRKEAFKAVPLGDSDTLKIGQDVCAIGNPSNLDKTMTKGIVSGLNRHYDSDVGYALSSIQVDAAINPGNSGGGLFDMYGNVVGVVNAKIVAQYTEGLGFAITINEAKPVINDLITKGYVSGRPMLGITILPINEYTSIVYGFEAGTTGLLVTEISEDVPASKSELRKGDIITGVEGKTVDALVDVQNIIKGMKAGDEITVTVQRLNENNKFVEKQVKVILTENKSSDN